MILEGRETPDASLTITYLLAFLLTIDSRSPSVRDTFFRILPDFVPTLTAFY